jgi:MPBQ/MSBQ methyltransferase
MRDDEPQLALELTEIILDVYPRHRGALEVQESALRRLAGLSGNKVATRIYAAAAQRVAARAETPEQSFVTPRRANYSGVWVRSGDEPKVSGAWASAWGVGEDGASSDHPGRTRRPDYLGLGLWTTETRSGSEARATLFDLLLAPLPRKTGSILVAQCGTGAAVGHLLNYYPPSSVMGIDRSEKRLRLASLRVPSCHFLVMSPTNLGFADKSYDNVIWMETANLLHDRRRFLREVHRVLEPGGRLVVADLLSTSRRLDAARTASTEQLMDSSEYRELYFDAGFERVEVVELTHELIGGLVTYQRRVLSGDAWSDEVDQPTRQQRSATIASAKVEDGYYLLVCAQKGLEPPLGEAGR